jgi:hypothetical protein
VIRDVFGRTSSDRATRDELTKTLASIQQRETERTATLERQQKADLAKEQRRQQANCDRLERGIDTARDRRERENWQRRDYHQPKQQPPERTPEPTTNREQAQKAEAKRKVDRDWWAKDKPKPEAEKPAPRSKPAKDWWRSTSTTHKPQDAERLKKQWDRSSNDNAAEKRSPWDNDIFGSDPFTSGRERGRDGPSPSPGGSGKGGGENGSGGNSGGSRVSVWPTRS